MFNFSQFSNHSPRKPKEKKNYVSLIIYITCKRQFHFSKKSDFLGLFLKKQKYNKFSYFIREAN